MQPRIGGSTPALQSVTSAESNGHAHASSMNGHASNGVADAATVAGTPDEIDELSKFLIDFVIEQTGYPREIVELDADLEADLGIDSIRKAQLFGEIGQKYDLQADDELSLDDFPTLRHLLEYMQPRIGGSTPALQSVTSAESNGHAHASSMNGHASNGVADAATVAGTPDEIDELSEFLIRFVIEQTGYPREIVDLMRT